MTLSGVTEHAYLSAVPTDVQDNFQRKFFRLLQDLRQNREFPEINKDLTVDGWWLAKVKRRRQKNPLTSIDALRDAVVDVTALPATDQYYNEELHKELQPFVRNLAEFFQNNVGRKWFRTFALAHPAAAIPPHSFGFSEFADIYFAHLSYTTKRCDLRFTWGKERRRPIAEIAKDLDISVERATQHFVTAHRNLELILPPFGDLKGEL